MAKRPNVLPHPQNALNKFMVRILIERDRLNDAFALDGNTAYPSTTLTPRQLISAEPCQDNAGGLVESHLEDMCHSLYGKTPELLKLIEETKTECCMVDANFAGILIPPLSAMVKVHRSCIEDLRNGKGWNWETHSEAFEELKQLSGGYTYKLNQMTANTVDKPVETRTPTPLNQIAANSADNPVALQPIAKKKKGRDSVSIKMNNLIIKLEPKRLPDKELALLLSEKLDQNITSEMIRSRKSRLRQKGEL